MPIMQKIYHLANCGTCQRIIQELGGLKDFEQQDIKTQPITAAQLDEMKKMAGSYDALFSRRAIKYKEMGLKDKALSEKEIRKLILAEYTFLKRPVIVLDDKIFVGNAPAVVAEAAAAIKGRKISGNAR
jgi:arsenate reductase